ncbi:hypothetical protein BD626DRAFT_573868 [Schizophyllum amplum]|uniref:Uncharacterized protein n=1 Tax=Schizophyllum amplum TaxID=97359 RepID=A0A550BZS1_9AGAR|nr:hypothetical protein BD626DRAFT_573868 [Auriculariopsis ampla]
MCLICPTAGCPDYELLSKVTVLGMTYTELLHACEEEEELWKKASGRIVTLNKMRTRWGDIYMEMLRNDEDAVDGLQHACSTETGRMATDEEEMAAGEGAGALNKWVEEGGQDL